MSANSIAQLGGGLIGGTIGFAVGGPIGASIGFSLGAAAGGLLVPAQLPDQSGPRLNDLTITGSEYGAPIPIVFGTARIACQMIWTTGKIETKHEEDVGGKGTPEQTVTTYTYAMSAVYSICEGEIVGIRRVWMNSILVYDHSDGADGNALAIDVDQADAVNVYTGSEDQLPSALIEAYEGVGNVPAGRGVAMIEFDNLQLADFGNGPVNVEVEVVRSPSTSLSAPPTQVGTFDNGTFVNCGVYQGMLITNTHDNNTVVLKAYDFAGNFLGDLMTIYATVTGPGTRGIDVCQNDPSIFVIYGNSGSGTAMVYKESVQQGTMENPLDRNYPLGAWDSAQTHLTVNESEGEPIVRIGMYVYTSCYTPNIGSGLRGIARWPIIVDQYGVEWISTLADKALTLQDLGLPAGFFVFPHLARDDAGYLWVAWQGTDATTAGNYAVLKLNYQLDVLNHFGPSVPSSAYTWTVHYRDDGLAYWIWADKTASHKINVWEFDPEDNNTAFTLVGNQYSSTAQQFSALRLGNGFFKHADAIWTMDATVAQGTMTLQQVTEELAAKVGLDSTSDVDMSPLSGDTVRGFVLSTPMAARNAMEPLQRAYTFDVPLIDNKLVAVKRGGASVKTIPSSDLDARPISDSPGDLITISRSSELELPRRLTIQYIEQTADYQPGEHHVDKLTARGNGASSISMPLVLTADEAAQLTEKLLFTAYAERNSEVSFSLSGKYLELTPADVITLGDDLLRVRLNEVNTAIPLLMRCTGTVEYVNSYVSSRTGTANTVVSTSLFAVGPSDLFALDIPILREQDNDHGIYLATAGYLPSWKGALVYRSADAGASYTQVAALLSNTRHGKIVGSFASGVTHTWDMANTLTIRTSLGLTLGSASELSVLNGTNLAVVGAPGRWEIIQWVTAVDNGNGTFTLSQLLRGRKGTEHNIGSHVAGDYFITLNSSSTLRYLMPQNAGYLYKPVSIGGDVASTNPVRITNTGVGQMPLSVCQVAWSRDGSNNLTLTWERRSRLYYNSVFKLPLGEVDQSYEIEFWNAGETAMLGSIKTYNPAVTLDDPTYTYTAAQQTTDGATPGDTFVVKIYQMSAAVGRGHEWKGTV